MANPASSGRTIEGTFANVVNNTSGGVIFQFNGSPTTGDYDQINRLVTSMSNSRAGNQGHRGPSDVDQSSVALLVQLLGCIGSGGTIRNCTFNGTNNTSGGLMVLVNNNASQGVNTVDVSTQETMSAVDAQAGYHDGKTNYRTSTGPQFGQPPPSYVSSYNTYPRQG